MPDQVITVLSAGDFLSTVSSNLDVMAGIFSRYFSGADNLRIVSIILIISIVVTIVIITVIVVTVIVIIIVVTVLRIVSLGIIGILIFFVF